MRTAIATEQLDKALTSVRQVLSRWNPADFDSLDACHDLLEQAVKGMRDFEDGVRQGTVSRPAKRVPSSSF